MSEDDQEPPVDVWKDYRDAGHDVESMLETSCGPCAICGTWMINLSEDLMYGGIRKCKPKEPTS